MQDVQRHYDLLIDESNDPIHDPAELQAYMDQWDGNTFLQALALDGTQSVLEIGVGTGRLALRTAPLCRSYTGIDLSPKTITRAEENLTGFCNVTLLCGDFLTTTFADTYDVIYSSLTFMHIAQKEMAIAKIASLLVSGGQVVLSLDKSRDEFIDYGTRRIRVYPDDPKEIAARMESAGLTVLFTTETAFAHIIAAERR